MLLRRIVGVNLTGTAHEVGLLERLARV